MKKLSALSAIFLLLMATVCEAGAAPIKFTGTWVLNREKSRGLTDSLPNSEWILVVSQEDKKIFVEQQFKIRGREQPSQELVWNLDGSESSTEVVRPMAGTMRLKARWIEASKTLELDSTIGGDDQGKDVSVTTKEVWELSQAGKVLKITRTRISPQGRQTFKLYFEKQE